MTPRTWAVAGDDRTGRGGAAVESWLDEHFSPGEAHRFGEPHAVVAVDAAGAVLAERYATGLGVDGASLRLSWSMAKSVTHSLVGLLVGEGRLSTASRAADVGIDAWAGLGDDDARSRITLEHLLRMVDGLAFAEEYEDAGVSDTIEMLFGSGADDVAGYAAGRPPAHEPGDVWSYSSGTTNLVAAIVGRHLGGRAGVDAAIQRLFADLGGGPVDARFDAAGTFVGSSYLYATARDFARFGLLHLHDGRGPGGAPLLPEGWAEHGRTPTPASHGEYAAHWWQVPGRPERHRAQGYETQRIVVARDAGVVVVRLGKTDPAIGGDPTDAWLEQGIDAVLAG